MISEKEFQEALIIVNSYIKQVNDEIVQKQNRLEDFEKTDILKWIDIQKKILGKWDSSHTRLFNILQGIYEDGGGWHRMEFVEDVLKERLSIYRNSSEKVELLFREMMYKFESEKNKNL